MFPCVLELNFGHYPYKTHVCRVARALHLAVPPRPDVPPIARLVEYMYPFATTFKVAVPFGIGDIY